MMSSGRLPPEDLLRKTEEEDGGPPEMEDLRSFVIGYMWPRPLLEVYIRTTAAAGRYEGCMSVCVVWTTNILP